jgi:glycosyltransferase involved in cell wall biosynthesis
MENGKTKVWFPLIRAGSGSDVFTRRLAAALEREGFAAELSWFPLQYEPVPFLLGAIPPPTGTDIVFANSWNGFAFKRTDIPLVVTVHHSGFDPSPRSYRSPAQNLYHRLLVRPFEMRSLRTSDAITAVSNYAAAAIKRHDHSLGPVETIYNWVDTERFRPVNSSSKAGRVFRLLFVGKPSLLKGADLLPKIMRLLGRDFELRIAGSWDQRAYDMPDNVQMLGWLSEENLIQAYQESDALLFPSRSEGFGYAALEAMACGIPVIASNCTSLPEVISDCITGLLCTPDDVSVFANACRQLADSPAWRNVLAQAARQKAVEEFSEKFVLPRYIELINRLTGR